MENDGVIVGYDWMCSPVAFDTLWIVAIRQVGSRLDCLDVMPELHGTSLCERERKHLGNHREWRKGLYLVCTIFNTA